MINPTRPVLLNEVFDKMTQTEFIDYLHKHNIMEAYDIKRRFDEMLTKGIESLEIGELTKMEKLIEDSELIQEKFHKIRDNELKKFKEQFPYEYDSLYIKHRDHFDNARNTYDKMIEYIKYEYSNLYENITKNVIDRYRVNSRNFRNGVQLSLIISAAILAPVFIAIALILAVYRIRVHDQKYSKYTKLYKDLVSDKNKDVYDKLIVNKNIIENKNNK